MKTGMRKAAITVMGVAMMAVSACARDVTGPVADGGSASMARGGGGGDDDNGGAGQEVTGVEVTGSGSSVTVSWTTAVGPYMTQVMSGGGTAGSTNSQTTYTTSGGRTSYTYTDLPAGTYCARVKVVGEGSQWSACVGNVVVAGPVEPTGDTTPPVISATVDPSAPNGNDGWYTSDVSITWSVTDGESAISGSSGCGAVSITADQQATTYTCSATSEGGTSSASVTIKRDATIPAISFSGSMSYTIDQTVSVTCSATDATSGIASSSCPGASGAAYTFASSNTLNASATDNAGNGASASATFTVTATYGSLCALVNRFVTNKGIANSLCVKLAAAERDQARGALTAKAGSLGAFAKEVSAQTGKSISAANAAILTYWAGTL